jgi:hypothetical protein
VLQKELHCCKCARTARSAFLIGWPTRRRRRT